MQKLKSMKCFENETLETEKMLKISGGQDDFSSRYVTRDTMDGWNCSDQYGRIDTDNSNGTWRRGMENLIRRES